MDRLRSWHDHRNAACERWRTCVHAVPVATEAVQHLVRVLRITSLLKDCAIPLHHL